jgi:radial spoke head protein 4A
MTEEGAIEFLDPIIKHVAEVVIRLADGCPERALDYFEVFSHMIKEEKSKDRVFKLVQENFFPDKTNSIRMKNRLFPKQKLSEEEEEQDEGGDQEQQEDENKEEEEAANEGENPNVVDDMRFMREVGVGLNEEETRVLQESIQQLIRSKPLATARFWGKVFCTEDPYYIVEAEFQEGSRPHAGDNEDEEKKDEEEPVEGEEKPKVIPMEEDSGVNLYSYFVCKQLGGKWELLPDITPAQMVASRCIRQMFTGNAKGEIRAPADRFPGGEYELLRCFISRVTQSCTLAPVGLYQLENEPEDDAPIESNAPIQMVEEPVYSPLKGLESFVHRTPCILPQGRTEYYIDEEEQQDDGDEEKEPFIEHGPPILTPISKDEPVNGTKCWSLRIVQGLHKRFWLRSNIWPGLHIVSSENGDRMVMMYFGQGMKSCQPLEWPPLPEKKVPPPPPKEEEEEDKKENEEEENKESQGDESKEPTASEEPHETEEGTQEESTYGASSYEDSNA